MVPRRSGFVGEWSGPKRVRAQAGSGRQDKVRGTVDWSFGPPSARDRGVATSALPARSASGHVDLPVISDDAGPAESPGPVPCPRRQGVAELGIDEDAAERIFDPLRVVRVHHEGPFPAVGKHRAVCDRRGVARAAAGTEEPRSRFLGSP